jgi:hypothetical protein
METQSQPVDLDSTMFMDEQLNNEDEKVRRYSVVGGDSTYAAYTKNKSYFGA